MEYRPNFKSKHFEGTLSAENEKEILTSLVTKNQGKSTLVHTSHCDAVYKNKVQEQAITTHFLTVVRISQHMFTYKAIIRYLYL
jgi:hypothetical protein